MANRQAVSVTDVFERALGDILGRVAISATAHSAGQSIALAYSGGLDSSVLLHLAHDYAKRHDVRLYAFHVHHGLSSNAEAWLTQCEQECALLGIPFEFRRVSIATRDKDGTEQAARKVRYAALGEMCRERRVPLLLTAHHQDDQAETILLQLLRGSGVAGMSGMEQMNSAPGLLGDDQLLVARPLLDVARGALEQFVVQREINYVEDESNADVRYARNALRHRVMPVLAESFPGFQQRFSRTARHSQAAQRLLDELAAQDLASCSDGECIDIAQMRQLNADRIDNLLRCWFVSRGARMPATAWLEEMRGQLLNAKVDACIRVTHADCEIRRHRGRIFLTPRRDDAELAVLPKDFRWHGEAYILFAEFGGAIYFDAAQEGIDAAWLRTQDLQIRFRSGGEKLKLAPDRPTRSLKQHYQALNIPAWERLRLPVVTAQDKLLFASGVGLNWRDIPANGVESVCLRWEISAA